MTAATRWPFGLSALALGCWLAAGCNVDLERMLDQKKAEPFEASAVFPDGKAMRTPPAGTVATSRRLGPPELVSGFTREGHYVERIPVPVDAARLARGEQRFQIFCRACHGALGDGESPVADAMELRKPVTLLAPSIVALPAGQIYRVISEGFGLMPSYGAQLAIEDRWAVVAYVQALQLSQSAKLAELPDELQVEAEPWLQ
ncbi:MAG TPA: cytochrome c [Polyangiaceae bacterium]|nr:cytochrome c [Polyangiaceae bacterium]